MGCFEGTCKVHDHFGANNNVLLSEADAEPTHLLAVKKSLHLDHP